MNDIWDSYKDAQKAKSLLDAIHNTSSSCNKIKLMEVCGTHTQAIFRFGIRGLLPSNIEIISGPGCPVCVTPNHFIDTLIALARKKNTIIALFGDMLKVPGSSSSLLKERSAGKDVRIIYSPLDALEIAAANENKSVIFSGIGFETTAPAIAAAVLEAEKRCIRNFYMLSAMKILPPALTALLSSEDIKIDGFILPGHVSAIIGLKSYQFLTDNYSFPGVIAGFEPVDIIAAILRLVQMITEKKPGVENLYSRIVKPEGNIKAQQIIYETFKICDSEWRGIGMIKMSGLDLKDNLQHRNPLTQIDVEIEPTETNPQCLCGEILRGIKKPVDCKLFRKVCTPENPVGSCMVSYEGTCSAYFKYC